MKMGKHSVNVKSAEVLQGSNESVPITERMVNVITSDDLSLPAAVGHFLVEQWISQKLSTSASQKLTDILNAYYKWDITSAEYQTLFKDFFLHPDEKQVIIGAALKSQLENNKQQVGQNRIFDNDALEELSGWFNLSINIYDDNTDLGSLGLNAASDPSITPLELYRHNDDRYSWLCDESEQAKKYNNFALNQANDFVACENESERIRKIKAAVQKNLRIVKARAILQKGIGDKGFGYSSRWNDFSSFVPAEDVSFKNALAELVNSLDPADIKKFQQNIDKGVNEELDTASVSYRKIIDWLFDAYSKVVPLILQEDELNIELKELFGVELVKAAYSKYDKETVNQIIVTGFLNSKIQDDWAVLQKDDKFDLSEQHYILTAFSVVFRREPNVKTRLAEDYRHREYLRENPEAQVLLSFSGSLKLAIEHLRESKKVFERETDDFQVIETAEVKLNLLKLDVDSEIKNKKPINRGTNEKYIKQFHECINTSLISVTESNIKLKEIFETVIELIKAPFKKRADNKNFKYYKEQLTYLFARGKKVKKQLTELRCETDKVVDITNTRLHRK